MKKLFTILTSLFVTGCGAPSLKMEPSDHFNGKTFFNPQKPNMNKTFTQLMKWRFNDEKKEWPNYVEVEQQKVPQKRITNKDLSITFINHSTFLLQMDGLNIITDPIWSERTSPVSWAGPKRVRKPGIKFEDLPKIDVILVSHNHYDHMDTTSLHRIIKRDNAQVVFGIGNSYYLNKESQKNSIELDWHQSHKVNDIEITFLPAKHWSRRTINDMNKSLWGAFSIKGSKKVYFAGDTGYGTHFKETFERYGAFYLSLLPIGAYAPRWFMKDAHMNPEEALKAHLDLKSKKSIGMHFGTFQLTDEGIDDPLIELKKQKDLMKIGDEFIVLTQGQSVKGP